MAFKEYEYIFVVTYGRSGSTLLQSLLNSLDGTLIRGENYNALFHLYQAFQTINETKILGRKRKTQNPDEPWFGAEAMQPFMFRHALLDAFVTHVLRPEDDTKRLGFKEIRYMPNVMGPAQFKAYMDFLLESFPNARIVFNTRNASDVAKSGWFADLNTQMVEERITKCNQRFNDYNTSSDRTILMHYDDYVADHSQIERLFTFVGHDYSSDTVEAIFSKPLNHVN